MRIETAQALGDFIGRRLLQTKLSCSKRYAERGMVNIENGCLLTTEDVPSESWTRGTDTLVKLITPFDIKERRIPTGGLLNRLIHGRSRSGTITGPLYRFEAEQDIRFVQTVFIAQSKESFGNPHGKNKQVRFV